MRSQRLHQHRVDAGAIHGLLDRDNVVVDPSAAWRMKSTTGLERLATGDGGGCRAGGSPRGCRVHRGRARVQACRGRTARARASRSRPGRSATTARMMFSRTVAAIEIVAGELELLQQRSRASMRRGGIRPPPERAAGCRTAAAAARPAAPGAGSSLPPRRSTGPRRASRRNCEYATTSRPGKRSGMCAWMIDDSSRKVVVGVGDLARQLDHRAAPRAAPSRRRSSCHARMRRCRAARSRSSGSCSRPAETDARGRARSASAAAAPPALKIVRRPGALRRRVNSVRRSGPLHPCPRAPAAPARSGRDTGAR